MRLRSRLGLFGCVVALSPFALWVGCGREANRLPSLSLSVQGFEWTERITFFDDNTARCEFAHQRKITSSQPFDYSYGASCTPRKVANLLEMVACMAPLAPQKEHSLPSDLVFRTFHMGRQVSETSLDYVQCLKSPVWLGLADECRVAANADLWKARASQQAAESLVEQGNWQTAARLYVDALKGIVEWSKRKVWSGSLVALDDSGPVVVAIEESLVRDEPQNVVERCRREWMLLWDLGVVIPPPESNTEPWLRVWRKPPEE